jgi:hypothetical protein
LPIYSEAVAGQRILHKRAGYVYMERELASDGASDLSLKKIKKIKEQKY